MKPCWYFNTNGTCRQGDNCNFSHDGARDSNDVAAATVQSITDKITNRVMDSIKKGRRGKKTQRHREDFDQDYDDDDDESSDNLLMNTLKNKGKKSKRRKSRVQFQDQESLYVTPIDSSSKKMHSKDVVGIDTDASKSISTNPQNFIPGMFDTSAEAT